MQTTENLSLDLYCKDDENTKTEIVMNCVNDNFEKIDNFAKDVGDTLKHLNDNIHSIHGLHGTKNGDIATANDGDVGGIFKNITMYGAYEQLATTGKNVLKLAGEHDTNIDGVTISVEGDIVTLNGVINITDSGVHNIVLGNSSTLSWDNGKRYTLSVWPVSGTATVPEGTGNTFAYSIFSQDYSKHFQGDTTQTNITNYTARDTSTTLDPAIVVLQLWRDGIKFDNFSFRLQVELGTTATSYEPYTGGKASPCFDYPQEIHMLSNPVLKISDSDTSKFKEINFSLPEEHPFLGMLPDGVFESIKIDDEGAVTLVRKIWHRKFKLSDMDNAENYPGWSIPKTDELMKYLGQDSDTVLSCISSVGGSWNVNTVGDTIRIYTKPETFNGLTQPEIIMKYPDITVDIYGKIETGEIEYPIGRIDQLLVPGSTFNVWADSDLDTTVRVEYPRDINIVIKFIEDKLAAIST